MFDDLLQGAILIICLAGLIGGAEFVVRHCVRLMKEKGLSGGFIGLTVISIGTSLPEILTHVLASVEILTGQLEKNVASATVLGMNVGSDIVQQNFLIGLVSLIGAVSITKAFLRRDFVILVVAAIVLWLMTLDQTLARWEGVALVVGYISYLVLLYRRRRQDAPTSSGTESDDDAQDETATYMHALWIAGALIVVLVCGHFALESVHYFVGRLNLGGSMIGVAVIGLATALPELGTALTSLRRNQHGLSIGTLVGSNITNPTFAVGIGAMISTYSVPQVIMWYDLPVKFITAGVILGLFARDRKLTNIESMALILTYFVYLVARMYWFPGDVFAQ